jgi:signal transduction histidine kinase
MDRIADRFARLHAASAALSAAVTAHDVAAALAARGAALPGATWCAAGFSDEARGTLVLEAGRGLSPALEVRLRELRVPPAGPLADALAGRRALLLREREACRAALPPLAGLPDGGGARAIAVLPLATGERLLGALAIGFRHARLFDEEERAFLEAFAHQGAQALVRARLYEAERAARLEAERAGEAARRAVELQERLVGVVGHDLRTPLASVQMATALLHRRGGLTEDQARTLSRLSASAERMATIIRDLLDFSRVRKEGGIPVRRGEAELGALVRRAVAELQLVHPHREIAVSAPERAVVEGDPDRLLQVVSNLVGNALQHSGPPARVQVAVAAGPRAVLLAVRNGGPPIDPDLVPELFEPFRHGRRGAPGPGGSLGLGLFIVRELVRAHGGEVEVTSEERGTTFTVRLPAPGAGAGRDAGVAAHPAQAAAPAPGL